MCGPCRPRGWGFCCSTASQSCRSGGFCKAACRSFPCFRPFSGFPEVRRQPCRTTGTGVGIGRFRKKAPSAAPGSRCGPPGRLHGMSRALRSGAVRDSPRQDVVLSGCCPAGITACAGTAHRRGNARGNVPAERRAGLAVSCCRDSHHRYSALPGRRCRGSVRPESCPAGTRHWEALPGRTGRLVGLAAAMLQRRLHGGCTCVCAGGGCLAVLGVRLRSCSGEPSEGPWPYRFLVLRDEKPAVTVSFCPQKSNGVRRPYRQFLAAAGAILRQA